MTLFLRTYQILIFLYILKNIFIVRFLTKYETNMIFENIYLYMKFRCASTLLCLMHGVKTEGRTSFKVELLFCYVVKNSLRVELKNCEGGSKLVFSQMNYKLDMNYTSQSFSLFLETELEIVRTVQTVHFAVKRKMKTRINWEIELFQSHQNCGNGLNWTLILYLYFIYDEK